MALVIMLVVMVLMLSCIKLGVGIVIPLFVLWFVMYLFCRALKIDFDPVFAGGMDALRKAMGAMTIIAAVGLLVGAFMSAGTIPAFIYYGLKLMSPKIFLPASVIICIIMAFVTGTSYGTVASAGIALVGIGTAMGVPLGMTAGAILTGALIGDKLSPLSDVPNLVSGLTDSDMFKMIKYMLWTTVIPGAISIVIFYFLGLRFDGANYDASSVNLILDTLTDHFHISIVALIPAIIVILLLVLKIQSVPAIIGGSVVGVLVSVLYQGHNLKDAVSCMYGGFSIETGVQVVDNLLNRGGLTSMAQAIFIMIGAVILGGMLDAMGVINAVLKPVLPKLNSEPKIVAASLGTACFINLVGSAAWLSNILTAKLMLPLYDKYDIDHEILGRTMEDGYVFGTIIFPWHAMTIYFTGVLGCTWAEYMPYIFYSYLTPIFTLLCAFTGIGMYHAAKKSKKS